jgi:hypothetical protein
MLSTQLQLSSQDMALSCPATEAPPPSQPPCRLFQNGLEPTLPHHVQWAEDGAESGSLPLLRMK